MIDLDLKDLRRDNLFVIRVYGQEFMKVNTLDKVKAVKKALNILGIKDDHIHIYKIYCEKVSDL